MSSTPYAYQLRGVRKIQHFQGRALLADEMGLGKTAQALWWVRDHLKPVVRGGKKVPAPVVIVCPKTIKENWRREAVKHVGMRAVILDGMKPLKDKTQLHAGRVYIINYDVLGHPGKKSGTWLRWLRSLKPTCVIIDEAHYIKSLGARRTKAVRELCRGIKHVIAISGTPLTSRPAELWPVLNLLRPDVYPAFLPFAFKHCGARRTPWGWDFRGATRLKLLHRQLNEVCMIRRLKKDVMDQLPAKTRSVVKIQMEKPREYQQAEKDFIKWLAKRSKRKAMRAAKAVELVKLGHLKRLAGELKLKAVFEWLDNYLEGTNEKLLIFGIHKVILHAILTRYARTAVLVDGSVTGTKRQAAIDRFNRDKSTRLFVGNIQAAGVGWSCTSTSNVLMVELDWVPGNHRQAEDRVHGIGRGKGAAQIWYVVAAGSIEEKICNVLEGKQGTLDQALDGIKGKVSLPLHQQLMSSYIGMTK